MNYTDEAACKALINKIMIKHDPLSDENDLRELCRFNTRCADLFWQEYMFNEEYLPYAMMSRNDHVSDIVSDKLNEYLDMMLEKTYANREDCLDGYYLLSFCLFKRSPRLIRTYRRIASEYKKLGRLRIKWSYAGFDIPDNFPDFLANRLEAEEKAGSENTFLHYLNDILITTMFDDIMSNGLKSPFAADMKEIFAEFPDAFMPANFAAAFAQDNSRAYDDFSFLRYDISRFRELMWVLDGLYSEEGVIYQGSPVMMTGPDNRNIHLEMKINSLDTRWISFICAAPFYMMLSSGTDDPYYAAGASERFSAVLCALASENSDMADILSGYFEDSSLYCGNLNDILGLRICGSVDTPEKLAEFYRKCSELSLTGRRISNEKLITKVFTDTDIKTRCFTEEECKAAQGSAEGHN